MSRLLCCVTLTHSYHLDIPSVSVCIMVSDTRMWGPNVNVQMPAGSRWLSCEQWESGSLGPFLISSSARRVRGVRSPFQHKTNLGVRDSRTKKTEIPFFLRPSERRFLVQGPSLCHRYINGFYKVCLCQYLSNILFCLYVALALEAFLLMFVVV